MEADNNLNFNGDTTLTPEQEQALKEQMLMGAALEETMKSPGWKYLEGYFKNMITDFTNAALVDGKTSQETESQRLKLVGVREMFAAVESAVQTLKDYRAREQAKKPKGGNNATI